MGNFTTFPLEKLIQSIWIKIHLLNLHSLSLFGSLGAAQQAVNPTLAYSIITL